MEDSTCRRYGGGPAPARKARHDDVLILEDVLGVVDGLPEGVVFTRESPHSLLILQGNALIPL